MRDVACLGGRVTLASYRPRTELPIGSRHWRADGALCPRDPRSHLQRRQPDPRRTLAASGLRAGRSHIGRPLWRSLRNRPLDKGVAEHRATPSRSVGDRSIRLGRRGIRTSSRRRRASRIGGIPRLQRRSIGRFPPSRRGSRRRAQADSWGRESGGAPSGAGLDTGEATLARSSRCHSDIRHSMTMTSLHPSRSSVSATMTGDG